MLNKIGMKKWLVLGGVVLVLAASAGAVFAQDDGPGNRGGMRDRMGQMQERMGDRGRDGVRGLDLEFVDMVAEAAGLERQELAERIRGGETLPAILAEAEVDIDALATDVVALATERIQMAADEGRITAERATAMTETITENIRAFLSGETEFPLGRVADFLRGPRGFASDLLRAVAEAVDLTPAEVRTALTDGQSAADLLEASGVDLDTFVSEQLTNAETRLAEAVESGRISQAVADARLNLMRVELIDGLNRVPVQAQ